MVILKKKKKKKIRRHKSVYWVTILSIFPYNFLTYYCIFTSLLSLTRLFVIFTHDSIIPPLHFASTFIHKPCILSTAEADLQNHENISCFIILFSHLTTVLLFYSYFSLREWSSLIFYKQQSILDCSEKTTYVPVNADNQDWPISCY